MRRLPCAFLFLLLVGIPGYAQNHSGDSRKALHRVHFDSRLPVREVTIFKDGHSFVLHAGQVTVGPGGRVQLQTLPNPILGTFWPYVSDPQASLVSVSARRVASTTLHPALTIRQLIEANPGAIVTLTLRDGRTVKATILKPQQPEPPATPLTVRSVFSSSGFSAPQISSFVEMALLKTGSGTLALPYDQIRRVTFHGKFSRSWKERTLHGRLDLKLDWKGKAPAKSAQLGYLYLQKGLRWIPSYRVIIDGKGHAKVKLQATLINELIDLKNVTAHLVIGVPSFAFKDAPDPVSLQDSFPALSRWFALDTQPGGSPTRFAMSNSMMGQMMGSPGQADRSGGEAPISGTGQLSGDRNEDLFLFTVHGITLKKGESMVIPVREIELKYRDLYVSEIRPGILLNPNTGQPSEQQIEVARLQRNPKFQHRIRLMNDSSVPLTTAPAMLLNGDRLLAQGMMTYTTKGAEADLAITTAGDIRIEKKEEETGRVPNAISRFGFNWDKVTYTGKLTVSNLSNETRDIDITRYVYGFGEMVGEDGTQVQLDANEELLQIEGENRYNPYEVNSLTRFRWQRKLAPGEKLTLPYRWSSFTH